LFWGDLGAEKGDGDWQNFDILMRRRASTGNWRKCNGLRDAGFDRWAFHPGMLFGAREKWWGDWGRCPRPHEGIDLVLYTNEPGHLLELDESARIPDRTDV
jgi:hypothetical protein